MVLFSFILIMYPLLVTQTMKNKIQTLQDKYLELEKIAHISKNEFQTLNW